MPGEADVLPENKLPIIADTTSMRQCLLSFRPKICAFACRQTKVPCFIWPEAEASSESRVLETGFRNVPRFRTRRERRIFHFHSVIKSIQPAGYRNATRITGSPDYRIERVLLVVVEPVDEVEQRKRRRLVSNWRDVFINYRRVNEGILPGEMPRHPIANDRGELADLQRQSTIIPGRDSQRIFVEPNLSAVIARVKAAIQPRL